MVAASTNVVDIEQKLNDSRYVVDVASVLRRLQLERRLGVSLLRLVALVSCLVCLLASACELQPDAEVAAVHAYLRAHFAALLQRNAWPATLQDVYAYAEAFERLNRALQVTSAVRWCERRYLEVFWNDAIGAPVRRCLSPRQHALGVPARAGWSQDAVRSSIVGVDSNSTCQDDEPSLQAAVNNANTTCGTAGASVCDDYALMGHCRRTCGYCDVVYEPLAYPAFQQPLAIVPPVIFQSKWPTGRCSGFAEMYNNQSDGPRLQLSLLPPSNVTWQDAPLSCPDRSGDLNSTGSHTSGNSTLDNENFTRSISPDIASWARGNRQRQVHGHVLDRPAEDLLLLKQQEWLDGFTETVTVGSVFYSDEAELFTYLAMDFRVGGAGELTPRLTLHSYDDVRRSDGDIVWSTLAICTIAIGAIGWFGSIAAMVRRCLRGRRKKSVSAVEPMGASPVANIGAAHASWSGAFWCGLEIFTYACVVALATFTYICRQSKAPPFDTYFKDLLYAYIGEDGYQKPNNAKYVLSKFLWTVTQLLDYSAWTFANRVAVWAVAVALFIQVLRHIGRSHPKMTAVFGAVERGFGDLCHIIVVFVSYFIVLAYAAHMFFGANLNLYSTFSGALSAQLRWLFGQFLVGDEAVMAVQHLSSQRLGLFWIYATFFVILLCWTFLYTVLAFLVDLLAGVRRKPDIGFGVANSIGCDVWDVLRLRLFPVCCCRRPARTCVLEQGLRSAAQQEASTFVSVELLRGQLPADFQAAGSLEEILTTYDAKLNGKVLVLRPRVACRVALESSSNWSVASKDPGVTASTDAGSASAKCDSIAAAASAAPSEASTDVSTEVSTLRYAAVGGSAGSKAAAATRDIAWQRQVTPAGSVPKIVHIPWANIDAQKELNSRVEVHVKKQIEAVMKAKVAGPQWQDEVDEVTAQISCDIVEIVGELFPAMCADDTFLEDTPSAHAEVSEIPGMVKAEMESNASEEV